MLNALPQTRKIDGFGTRIFAFDQLKFPSALPFLDALLASNGFENVIMHFVPDQRLAPVFPGEAGKDISLVLPDTRFEVSGHACVERPVASGGKDVHGRVKHSGTLQEHD